MPFSSVTPTAETIREAHERIATFVHRTPILTSQTLDELLGCHALLKCENLQKIGAFKARGAMNAALQLSSSDHSNGLVTHSSGNHAQAVAYAANKIGVKANVVMPDNSSKVKIKAVETYGGKITFCPNTPEDRQATVDNIVKETGAIFIHPFNDYRVIAGQATAAKEIFEDARTSPDYIVCPVGGGGLLSGTSLSAKFFSSGCKTLGAEPTGAADAVLSFQTGKIESAPFVKTIADGLLTPLGDKTLTIIKENVSDIFTVSDDEIIAAMRFLWERVKLVVEPSGAVGLALVMKYHDIFIGKNVAVILTGGNVDLEKLPFKT